MRWTARRAVPADVDAMARIHVSAWQRAYRGMVPDEVLEGLQIEQSAARFQSVIERTDAAALFVAVDGTRLGAFCGVCPVRHPERDGHSRLATGELAAIYADPVMRGTGAGHAVHEAGLAHLTAAGFRHAVLWVVDANAAARSFYTRHGWSDDGVLDHYDAGGHQVLEVRYSRML